MLREAKNNPWLAAAILTALGLGGGNLAFRPEAGITVEEIAAAENRLTKIEEKIDLLVSGRDTMEKHWKLHQWAKDEVNELRGKHDLPSSRWPDF